MIAGVQTRAMGVEVPRTHRRWPGAWALTGPGGNHDLERCERQGDLLSRRLGDS